MIVVNAYDDGISVTGHAGYAEYGKDIVCAAVSVLAQTLISSIEELTADAIDYSIADGKINIFYKGLTDEAQLLVDSFFVGVRGVETAYPEYVKVTEH